MADGPLLIAFRDVVFKGTKDEFLAFFKEHHKELRAIDPKTKKSLMDFGFKANNYALTILRERVPTEAELDGDPQKLDRYDRPYVGMLEASLHGDIGTSYTALDIIAARSGYDLKTMEEVKGLGFKHSDNGKTRLERLAKSPSDPLSKSPDFVHYVEGLKEPVAVNQTREQPTPQTPSVPSPSKPCSLEDMQKRILDVTKEIEEKAKSGHWNQKKAQKEVAKRVHGMMSNEPCATDPFNLPPAGRRLGEPGVNPSRRNRE